MNTPTLETRFARTGLPHEVVQQNEAVIRQGGWLFVPVPGLVVEAKRILRHEPVHRRAAQSHVVEEIFRTGGEAVYYSARKRRVLTVPQFHKLLQQRPESVREDWRIRQRDVTAYGRGTVRHPDHDPVTLRGWHRILMSADIRMYPGHDPSLPVLSCGSNPITGRLEAIPALRAQPI